MINISSIYPVSIQDHPDDYMAGLLQSILMRSNFVVHQRQAMGWRGLRPNCKGGNGWTCRIDGKDGVYGLFVTREEEERNFIRGQFNLCYFPQPGEDISGYSIEAATYTRFEYYEELVQDFLSYSDFYKWFEIGEVSLILSKEMETLWINLEGKRFGLGYSFFEIFVATVAESLDIDVEKVVCGKEGYKDLLGIGFGKEDYFSTESEEVYLWEIGSKEEAPYPTARWWNPLGEAKMTSESETDINMGCKPELIVLTGFLGSGKTTFLKHFIEYQVGYNRFVAVIQNEIGAQGLDGKLLEDDYAVLEMDEGCVCCSLVGQLKIGIKKIFNDHHPDIIILETTGLANPYNLLGELDQIKNLINFKSVCTIVDGKNFQNTIKISSIAVEQVKAADQVVLNKMDLLSDIQQAEICKNIELLNQNAKIHFSSYGRVNPSQIFDNISRDKAISFDQEIHHIHSDEGISSRKYIIEDILKEQLLLSEIKKLPREVLRVKGVVDIEGHENPCVLNYVNGSCCLEEMNTHIPDERYLIFIGKSEVLYQLSIFINLNSIK